MAPSPRQRDALRVILEFIAAHGYAPSHRDLADLLGYSTGTTARDMVLTLHRKGLIHRDPATARSMRLTADGEAAIQ